MKKILLIMLLLLVGCGESGILTNYEVLTISEMEARFGVGKRGYTLVEKDELDNYIEATIYELEPSWYGPFACRLEVRGHESLHTSEGAWHGNKPYGPAPGGACEKEMIRRGESWEFGFEVITIKERN